MIKGISIGNYFPGNSIIHKLDPRVKLICSLGIIISLFLLSNYWSLLSAILFYLLLVYLANLNLAYIFRGLKPLIILIVFTLVIHMFVTPGNVIYSLGPLSITSEGLQRGVFMAFRLTLLIGISVLLTATTPPIRLTDGLENLFQPLKKIRVPVTELALMISIALRFIPTYITETERIIKAQSSRGVDFQSGSIKERLENIIPILVPLFINSFKRAEDLAVAMEARCYRGGEGRTKLYPLILKGRDYAALLVLAVYMILLMYSNFYLLN